MLFFFTFYFLACVQAIEKFVTTSLFCHSAFLFGPIVVQQICYQNIAIAPFLSIICSKAQAGSICLICIGYFVQQKTCFTIYFVALCRECAGASGFVRH